jgi:hypothetical protein
MRLFMGRMQTSCVHESISFGGARGMLSEAKSDRGSLFKNPLTYSSMVVLIAVLAVGLVMYTRWENTRAVERQESEKQAERQREQDRTAVEELGGKEFAILDFYAAPKTITRGETAQLCYGVSNAKSVKLEPQTQEVWPSAAHCVDVSPIHTTTYTLTITDGQGRSKSQTLELPVR